ncbi:MAG: DUF1572 family protein, partial [Flavobacteriaceae bacterium]
MNFPEHYLQNILNEFNRYKSLGDKTCEQLEDEEVLWSVNDDANSIALLVKHMVGNMLSRFTNFLTEDGEKSWRNRDLEFIDPYLSKKEMIQAWEKGW